MLNRDEKKLLLGLARRAIEYYLDTHQKLEPDLASIPYELCETKGVFVTLFKNNELRGCIGYIEGVKPIWEAVIENAINAAFYDPRFRPLTRDELDNIEIEISILSPLKQIEFKDVRELLDKIDRNMGIVIKKGMRSATYLPEVWQHFDKKEDFLSSLCLKAGLKDDCWMRENIEVYFYRAEVFSERNF